MGEKPLLILLCYLDVVQHELLLRIVHRAVGAFEHRNFLIGDVLVKVREEQRLKSEHGVTHGALIDQPERQKNSLFIHRKKKYDFI